MRLHKRSLLRAFAAGIALCVAFGTAACSGGSTSQENDASADSETPTEQITPIEVVASVNQWGSLAEQIGGGRIVFQDISMTVGDELGDGIVCEKTPVIQSGIG